MKTGKSVWVRLLTICIALSLLISNGAAAAAPTETTDRQKDLDYLYSTLKSSHPNLFANTPEAAFEAKKAEIEKRLDTESSFDFSLDCASLAALAKDSHTSVSLGSNGYNLHYSLFDMEYFNGTWILSAIDSANKALLGAEVSAINGLSMEQVLEKYSTIISADNPVKVRYAYWQMCYVLEPYVYLGIAKQGEPLTVTVKDAAGKLQSLSVSAVEQSALKDADLTTLQDRKTGTAVTAYDKTKAYFAKELSSTTYYIQYNKCAEDQALPMKTFCQQIQTALDKGKYNLILVDLRNNGGGSDGVIVPLMMLLAQQRSKGVQVAGLIGNKTFSSAIINAVELQEMGFPLAGEETVGSVDHFGSIKSFQMPASGLRFSVSSKFISLSGYFDAAVGKGVESLQPDVKIPQTLTDMLAGKDTCIEQILANPAILKPADRNSAAMTRGRFVGLVYQAAGSPAQGNDVQPFADVLGIEWYLPALNWAKWSKIALGNTKGSFLSSRAISWQETAVFLVRSAEVLGIKPASVRTDSVPATLITAQWNGDAVQKAWSWGLIPENGDFSTAPTRAQGEAMIKQLFGSRRTA